jgi:hypothetical protein
MHLKFLQVLRLTGVLLITSMLFTNCATQQKVSNASILNSFEIVTDLDIKLTETSGLETMDGALITHNDSDAGPTLFFMTTDGVVQEEVTYNQMKNIDWEDIARSDQHFYIADIGNNYGDRKDLTIYKISIQDLKNEDAAVQRIAIDYKDQPNFERREQQHSFDGEAIVHKDDELLLFSKDWSNFTTDVYHLNTGSGKQSVIKKQTIQVNGLITGATHNGGDRIVLCGYDSLLQPFVAVLTYTNGNAVLQQRIDLPLDNGAQIEAITYYKTQNNLETYYLTSEAINLQLGEDEAQTNGQLYVAKLRAN